MAKENLEKVYSLVEKMTTEEQIELQAKIQSILDNKAAIAEQELSLIKNKGK